MSDTIELTAPAETAGTRIDKYISENIPELTRSAVQNLIADSAVLVSGKAVNKNYKLKGGEK